MTLYGKLFLLVLAPLGILLGFNILTIVHTYDHNKRYMTELSGFQRDSIQQAMITARNDMDFAVSILATSPNVIRGIETNDHLHLFSLIRLVMEKVDEVLVTDADGVVLVRAPDEFRFGDRLDQETVYRSTMALGRFHGEAMVDGHPSWVVAMRADKYDDLPVGIVMVSIRITPERLSSFLFYPNVLLNYQAARGDRIRSMDATSAVLMQQPVSLDLSFPSQDPNALTMVLLEDQESRYLQQWRTSMVFSPLIVSGLLFFLLLWFFQHYFRPYSHTVQVMSEYASKKVEESHFRSELKKLETTPHHRVSAIARAITHLLDALQANIQARDQSNEELRSAVHDLQKAKGEVEKANQAKTEFLANMSHEIRTPLTSVIGYLDLLRESDLGSPQNGYLKHAHTSAQILMSILNDVLDFSKIEAGKLELELMGIHLKALVQEVVSIFELNAQKKGLHLTASIQEPLPKKVLIDPIRVRQILVNLLGNAIKFTEKGGIHLRLKWEPTSEHHQGLFHFSVQDTGIGIGETERSKLFKAFSQADTSINRRFGGSGLGLAISQRLLALMGGEMQVESQAGIGSTFSFTIPAEILPDASGIKPSRTQADEESPDKKGVYPSKVLIVDDVDLTRELIEANLRKTIPDIDVITAENGEQAVASYIKELPDMVLMDLQMPVMDGYAAAKAIRNWEKQQGKAEAPIVALTASVVKGERERCMEAGMNQFLTKPINPHALIQLMKIDQHHSSYDLNQAPEA